MVWPSEVKTFQLSVYRGISERDIAAKFSTDDQIELAIIRESLERKFGGDRNEVINQLLMACGTIKECRAFARCLDNHAFLEPSSGLHVDGQVVPIDTKGDGACFFRSIGYSRSKDPRFLNDDDELTMYYLQIIRDRIVQKVIEMWNQQIHGLTMSKLVYLEHHHKKIKSREEYESYMSRPFSWAGQPEVLAAAECYKGLEVYQEDTRSGENPKRFVKHTYGDHQNRKVKVFFNGTNHYTAVEVEG